MANVLRKSDLQYLKSVHTPAYPTTEYIINPVLPTCEKKYWKIVGDEVVEMTANEKIIKDAEIQAEQDALAEARKDIDKLEKLTKALALVILDEINTLRINAGLSERTVAQLRNAVKTKYDTLE